MRRNRLFLTVLVLGMWFTLGGCSGSNNPEFVPIHNDNALADPKPQPGEEAQSIGWGAGVVSAVGPDWFELAVGWRGRSDVLKEQPEDNSKPRRFFVTGTKVGGDPNGPGKRQTHQIRDLKIGDAVELHTWKTRDGMEWPRVIQITRRPGGRIPAQFGDPGVDSEYASHLRDQADQDWEEKGAPIPKKYLDPQGRAPWTNPPYPPVAPDPRPAKPKP